MSPRSDLRSMSSGRDERAVAARALLWALLSTLVLLAVSVGVGWPLYARYEEGLWNAAVADEERLHASIEQITHDEFASIERELTSLAIVPGVEAVLDPASGQDRSEVEGFLAGIARRLHRYDQLRIIDLDGQELARIDDRGGVARVVPADELQNKASRYYVAETLALAPGEIYVSPLDLNIEQGEIEVPYVPMIRFGTLVTDDAGRSAGMVVLNYRGDLILDTIREATQNEAGGALRLLVNDAGYFLLGASPDDEWGWMFERSDLTLERRYPAIASALAVSPAGVDRFARSATVYRTIDPLRFPADQVMGAATSVDDPASGDVAAVGTWSIISVLDASDVLAPSLLRQPIGWLALVVAVVLIFGASLAIATVRVQRVVYRRALEEERIETEDLYENAPIGYHTTDASGRIQRINRTELAWLGYERDDVVHKMRLHDVLAPESHRMADEFLAKIQSNEAVNDVQMLMLRKDGTTFPVALASSTLRNDKGAFALARTSAIDISDRRRLETELKHEAHTDPLTGVLNRRRFFEVGALALARSRRADVPISLLSFDLDHFKDINDQYGHHCGDDVLKSFATTCQKEFRDRDVFARIGGEEFVGLLPSADLDTARRVAERLRAVIETTPVQLDDGQVISITTSIGVAAASKDDKGLDAVLRRADKQLYRAKDEGRNRVSG